MVQGDGAFICEQCIHAALECVQSEDDEYDVVPEPQRRRAQWEQTSPKAIKEGLDEYVIGHEHAKKTLAVAVYNHFKRVETRKGTGGVIDVDLEKSNVLLLGPSGTGKTLLARTLARILDVPFSISDATTLTEAGYVGEDVETILTQLLSAADYDVEATERGIVFIDEIDKIARKGQNTSVTRDVSGEGVQQSLLKVLEGTIARVPPKGGRKHPEQNLISINTRDILFICGGAFVGLPAIIARRLNVNVIGFEADSKKRMDHHSPDILEHVIPEDLLKFGLIPELVGRLSVVAALRPLTDEAMKRILTEPTNALIPQYEKLLRLDRLYLQFDDEALDAIVAKAQQQGTGARGLRSVMEDLMLDIMYNASAYQVNMECRITRENVLHGSAPVVRKRWA